MPAAMLERDAEREDGVTAAAAPPAGLRSATIVAPHYCTLFLSSLQRTHTSYHLPGLSSSQFSRMDTTALCYVKSNIFHESLTAQCIRQAKPNLDETDEKTHEKRPRVRQKVVRNGASSWPLGGRGRISS